MSARRKSPSAPDHPPDPATLNTTEFMRSLRKIPPSELAKRQSKIDSLALDLGIHFSMDGGTGTLDHHWKFDIIPHIIPRDEWKLIETGLIQRTRAFSHLITDLYTEQRILRERVIPHELIFEDPAYLYEYRNSQHKNGVNITVGAADLVRDTHGRWFVSQNHYSTPFGISFIMQHRRMLGQAFPEIFQSFNASPVSSFLPELVERLAALSDKPNPHIVLLSHSTTQDNFFEESFLARRMGIAIVKPADLIVRESRVYLKTIRGLEQVDVIYRRMKSRSIDPIAFRSNSGGGIPGLVNCARKGTVAIANALGCGVADNKALLRHSDSIIRFYLREQPLLQTLPTYTCRDYDQLDHVKSHLDSFLLRPIHRQTDNLRWQQHKPLNAYENAMRTLLRENPGSLVAHPRLEVSQIPRFEKGRLIPRPVFLRAFLLMGENPLVLPGGLTRQSLPSDKRHIVANLASGVKDTWIHAEKKTSSATKSGPRRQRNGKEFKIPSRVAESLYWIGRYTERAENTSRMVGVLEELGWHQLGRRERRNVWPLWQAVAFSTGQTNTLKTKAAPGEVAALNRQLITGRNNTASVFYCILQANQNTQAIREFITPEVWTVLSRFMRFMEECASALPASPNGLREICQACVNEIACLNGTIQRTMPHDDSLEFYRLGMLVERSICTATVLDIVLTRALENTDPAYGEDPDLTSLLRLLSSLDAYQREFRSRTYAGQVAELLWRNPNAPSSVAYCCKHIIYSLRNVLGVIDKTEAPPLLHAEALMEHIRKIRCVSLFPGAAFEAEPAVPVPVTDTQALKIRVEKESTCLEQRLHEVNVLIEDHFFNHQSGFRNVKYTLPPIPARP